MTETFDLQRFVDAQDAGGTWERALAELRAILTDMDMVRRIAYRQFGEREVAAIDTA